MAAGYDKIGCNKCAEILRLSLSLFPDSVMHAGWDERIKFVESNSETFGNLSNAFWDADEEMRPRLAEYIINHGCLA